MEEELRSWQCRNCGRSNKTMLELDGTAKCEYCRNVMKIQPSRNRAAHTPDQVARYQRTRLA